MKKNLLLVSASLIALTLGASPALALDTAPAQTADQTAIPGKDAPKTSDATAAGEDIVVTGSRVTANGAQAPTPVTVVSADQLEKASPGTVGEALNQLPVFRGSTRPNTGGTSAIGPTSGSFLNLRNLGAVRTLLLIDGRRAAPTSTQNTTDTNIVPEELVQRVDVVTGGASAAYGSDAIAGATNFILNTKFKGLKAQAQSGINNDGKGASYKLNLTGGTSFAGGRARVIGSVGYFDTPGIQSVLESDLGAQRLGTIPSPTNPALLTFQSDVRSSISTYGGLITSGPLALMQFTPGGTLIPYNTGTVRGSVSQSGGDGAIIATNLTAAVRMKTAFGHAEFDVTPKLMVFAQASFADIHNRYNQVQQFNLPGLDPITIFSGNAFLNPTVQAQLTSRNLASIAIGRFNTDFGDPSIGDSTNQTLDLTAGFKWSAPADWIIDGYVERGRNRLRIQTFNNVDLQKFYAAADAVRDPSGNIVCNVTLTNPGLYPGCVPINLQGQGAPTSAAINYVEGTSLQDATITQYVASLSARGKLFSTWAGAINAAVGVEYRTEDVNQTTDAIAQRVNTNLGLRGFPANFVNGKGGWLLTNVQPLSGSYNIKEVFGEVAVPLARDTPVIGNLDLNAAARYTDYSNSGGVTTWKVGGTWQPLRDVRFRVTRSRDIRAPNIPELYSIGTQSTGSVNYKGVVTPLIIQITGNTALKPERADTFTVGGVFTPRFLPGFSFSVDYYKIDIADVISNLTQQQQVDQCVAGNAALCQGLIFNGSGTLTRVIVTSQNLSKLITSGLDFELGYRAPGRVLGGNLTLRAIASNLLTQVRQLQAGTPIDTAGEVGISPNPYWSGVANANWERGGFGLFVQGRFVGSGFYDKTRVTGVTITDNSVPATAYVDTTISYKVATQFKVYLTVNNLLDNSGPKAPFGGQLGVFYPSNPQLYDQLGRYFTTGVKLQF